MRAALLIPLALWLAGCAPLEIGPGPRHPRTPATATAPSAPAAIDAFATAYINWTAGTVVPRLRMLEYRSVGQARSAMAQAAAQAAGDYELQQDGISNRGTVEAVAPLAGALNEYVVVTLEQTSATGTHAYQGLIPAWHLTLATVVRERRGAWVLSGWQPEN